MDIRHIHRLVVNGGEPVRLAFVYLSSAYHLSRRIEADVLESIRSWRITFAPDAGNEIGDIRVTTGQGVDGFNGRL